MDLPQLPQTPETPEVSANLQSFSVIALKIFWKSLVFLSPETNPIIFAIINGKRGALTPCGCLQQTSEDDLLVSLPFLSSVRSKSFLDKRRWKSRVFDLNQTLSAGDCLSTGDKALQV